MCGICGIYDPKHRLTADQRETDVAQMRNAFAYRGPDDQGAYSDPEAGVALGHLRLSIIDLAGGHQPMSNNAKNLWVTFNGEIYNYAEERAALQQKGYRFQTHSDTETILALYETYGSEAWSRLRGQFAFAIWDSKVKRLHLVRDRIGEKPLVYAYRNDVLYFGSEVKGLLRCPSLPKEIDRSVLGTYFLTQGAPAPTTLIQGMQKLLPGHSLTVDRNGIALASYWKPAVTSVSPPTSLNESVAQFQDHFRAAVQMCTVSDVPVGTYLSGGMDSTSVTALVKEIHPEPFHTFAIFNRENHESHPDWRYAQQAAALYKTQHHNVLYDLDELFGLIPELIDRADEPFEGPTVMVSYFLAKHARQHVKVVLTGNGGDELLGGYQSYYQAVLKLQGLWQQIDTWLPGPVRRLIATVGQKHTYLRRMGMNTAQRRAASSVDFYRGWFDLLFPGDAENTLSRMQSVIQAHRSVKLPDYFKQYLWDDLFVFHHRSVTVMPDSTGMACSLEARNPFLDHKLVEFLLSLPPDHLIHQKQNKYLLAKAMESRVPAEVINRPKEGFSGMTGQQMNRWLRSKGKKIFHDALLDSRLVRDGVLNRAGIEKVWRAYEAQQDPKQAVYFQLPIWTAGMLAQWYDRHVAA